MIYMILIINISSGITLFTKVSENFHKKIKNSFAPELIGSFLTAMWHFSRELGQNGIKSIEMNDLRFLMYEKNETMIFFLIEGKDEIQIYKEKLIKCLNAFLMMYPHDIKKEVKKIKHFRNFEEILNQLIKPACFQEHPKENPYLLP
ncbi:MAG: hypothetical protein ACTSYC_11975 [Promethearchaeota archaeon]